MQKHVALNAKIIDFGGWAMPVQYTNVIEEHKTTATPPAFLTSATWEKLK